MKQQDENIEKLRGVAKDLIDLRRGAESMHDRALYNALVNAVESQIDHLIMRRAREMPT